MVPTAFTPHFTRLFAHVNTQSARLIDEVLDPENERALLVTRGKLSAYQLQADILRYHLNRNLCRKEDVEHLYTSWDGMSDRLIREAQEKGSEQSWFLAAAASVLIDGVLFLGSALLQFEHQLDDDGQLQDCREDGQPPVAVGAMADTIQNNATEQ